ncbi:carbohydrate ABC transporter permease [Aquibacillus albus]|uniref:Multiple sugar transport system permease protein n=1 Tax=Aquibacillus albus TaxID=1168171 RepID=A0ABS2MW83_9BACI|nr:sugar ABC transporter permease [Aquibacillus albus]MBM7570154.1 multiple sugar transport system permease protein [Aquibacillus albus]
MNLKTDASINVQTKPKVKNKKFKKKIDLFTDHLFIVPSLLFFLIFLFYPIVYNILISFKEMDVSNFMDGGTWAGFVNYKAILTEPLLYKSLLNSAIFTLSCIIVEFILGFSLALLFIQKFPGVNFMRGMILVVWMLPSVVVGTLYKWIMAGDSGVLNFLLEKMGIISEGILWVSSEKFAMFSVIVANIWHGTPFYMIILLGGLSTLPRELFEAARIDGANAWKSFLTITLPLMKPTIFVLIMLGLINSFKVFDLIYVMTSGGPLDATTVIPYYAYELSFLQFNFGQGGAVSGIMLFLVIILAIVYLREMRKEEIG